MKKILLILTACLLLVLSSCNNSKIKSCAESEHDLACVPFSENHVYKCTRAGCEYEEEPMPHYFEALGEPCADCGIDYETGNLEFTLAQNGKSYIVSGIGNCKDIKEITIPKKYNELPVTEIGNEAFYSGNVNVCYTVERVRIPTGVIKIGDRAFESCANLCTVNLPPTITHIGHFAFASTAIESIYIPNSVVYMGERVFIDCQKLSQVNIPEGITELHDTFMECTSLESIALPQSLRVLSGTFCDSGLKSIIIPDKVELIEDFAFSNTQLETVVIGDGVKNVSIGYGVFSYCLKLKEVIIRENVKSIGESAFSDCIELTDVIIDYGVKKIEYKAFSNCTKLTNITIPDSIEFIKYNAFDNCPSIAYNVYEGMNYLGNEEKPYLVLCSSAGGDKLVAHSDTKIFKSEALLNEENITEICIGPNVEYINSDAIVGMDGVTKITVDENNQKFYSAGNCLIEKETKTIIQAFCCSVIPSDGSVTAINMDIFSHLGTLEVIYIPKGIKTVTVEFSYCASLTAIIIESDITKIQVTGNDNNGKFNVFYCHAREEWRSNIIEFLYNVNSIIKPVDEFTNSATHYLYSQNEPEYDGNFWHYVDGEIVIWE